ncbi:Ankyrin repeat-containing domain-containing protein [Cinnamomum micranthum f. kanehirae]|uniref:Ankyrin repeat-containing domain-containing protein n=1 Tax=Cinnamomum micranthum f. kanehirae TaxID=337451 RepID=A0A443NAU9_9MAGN|nr:Ankyrin repeat-containing domain-containing protein [Cinnamomum micranthum f. kanehirae]
MMELIMKKIIPGIQGKKVLVEAEKIRSDAYRFKMPKDPKDAKDRISPILVAAKNGVVEIVKEILNAYSLAIYDEDTDKKNAFMLAVENRQLDIYNIFLRQRYCHQSIIFQKTDKDGNSAIHLAATTGPNQRWPIPGAALQMQWELKWYEHVRETMPHNIFTTHRNNEGMTSKEVFDEAHKTMLKEGVKWLTNTAQSCSVVAALVATVAYASATTVPGGVEKGIPLLRNTYAFSISGASLSIGSLGGCLRPPK